MKLLLTSGGITNPTLAKALEDLLPKPKSECGIVFIPTAANAQKGDKGWLIHDLYRLNNLGYKYVDIVDITAVEKDVWKQRLETADVLFFGGGNTAYLMQCIVQSSLAAMLPDLLKTKVYAGISAGSMVAGCKIPSHKEDGPLYDIDGLNFVPLCFRPHLYSDSRPQHQLADLERAAKNIPYPLYCLNDGMALKIIDEKIDIVGEGEYVVFNS